VHWNYAYRKAWILIPKMHPFSSAANAYRFVTKAPCRNGAGACSDFYFTIHPVRLSFLKYLLTGLWNLEFGSSCNRNFRYVTVPALQTLILLYPSVVLLPSLQQLWHKPRLDQHIYAHRFPDFLLIRLLRRFQGRLNQQLDFC